MIHHRPGGRAPAPMRPSPRRLARLAALLLAAGPALLAAPLAAAQAPDRLALVIGTEDYAHAPRAVTAQRDARAVAEALRQAGYAVTLGLDPDRAGLRRLLGGFAAAAPQAGVAVLYLSGHALRTGGRSYLAARDARADSLTDVLFDGVPLELALRAAGEAQDGAVVFLDAAQLDGFAPGGFAEPGLAAVEPGPGVLVVSAAAPGLAVRRSPERESRFARLVIDRFLEPDLPAMAAMRAVSGELWAAGGVPADLALVPPPPPLPQDGAGLAREIELAFWEAAERTGAPEDYAAYLARYPAGEFAALARNRLARLEEASRDPDERAERALGLDRAARAAAQRALATLGHDPRGVDGVFGPATRAAIAGWQQASGLRPSGFLPADQHERLLREAGRAEREAARRREAEARAEAARDDALWAGTGAQGTGRGYRAYLEQYPEGRHAEEARAGLERLAADRRDAQAEAERALWRQAREADRAEAYRDYLARHPRGAWAAEARRRLAAIEDAERARAGERVALRQEAALGLSRGDRLSVELRLAALGYDPGRRDGAFDGATRRAIADYQAARRLPATGHLDRRTLLGLVRETGRRPEDLAGPTAAEVILRLLQAMEGR